MKGRILKKMIFQSPFDAFRDKRPMEIHPELMEIKRKCVICEKEKSPSEFYIRDRILFRNECKECRLSIEEDKYKKLRLLIRKNNLFKKYGVSEEEYMEMHQKQNGCCAICLKPEKTGRMLAVDHNHKTGKVRGLLCKLHNMALGHFENENLLERAILYLNELRD